jgi:hypothetical protein
MKYKLFTAADPSDSKKIGVSDTVNVLPEINKRGQLCWRSRPGLGGPGYDLSVGGGGEDCLYDGTEFGEQEGFPPWDVIDNVTGNYSCTPGDIRNIRIITNLITGTLKTCYFIYKVTDFTLGVESDSIVIEIQNGGTVPKVDLIGESTVAYVNLSSDRGSLRFVASGPTGDPAPIEAAGTVYIECVQIVDRDWETAGEDINTVYYP